MCNVTTFRTSGTLSFGGVNENVYLYDCYKAKIASSNPTEGTGSVHAFIVLWVSKGLIL
jgi:hypothetical protein